MKLNKFQKELIERIKDGAFRDSIGFIEFTKKGKKLGYWIHSDKNDSKDLAGKEISYLINTIWNSGLDDLVLILDMQNMLLNDKQIVKLSLN